MPTAVAESARLLLALDACGVSGEVVERAVAVAAGLDAVLEGLFVEDEALAHAAALPFACEVRVSGGEQPWNRAALDAASRRAAGEAARLIEQHAVARRVRWRFATATGARLAAVFAAGERADLLLPARRHPSPYARATSVRAFQRICLLYDESPQTERALQVVQALAANGHTRELRVFGARQPGPRAIGARAGRPLDVRFEHADPHDAAVLLRAMTRASAGGLVILPKRLLPVALTDLSLDTLPGSLLLLG